MNEAEDLVVTHLERCGFRCEPFTKVEMRAGKTPDRRVYRGDELAFLLEVKEVVEDDFHNGIRNDPHPNRLASDIHDAVKQFDAVNPTREQANVLAIVNNDAMCGSLDLHAVLTGNAVTESGEALPIYNRQARGRIREEKFRVDAYLWFEGPTPTHLFLNGRDRRHESKVRRYLGPVCGNIAG
jgi:hypothetical protein